LVFSTGGVQDKVTDWVLAVGVLVLPPEAGAEPPVLEVLVALVLLGGGLEAPNAALATLLGVSLSVAAVVLLLEPSQAAKLALRVSRATIRPMPLHWYVPFMRFASLMGGGPTKQPAIGLSIERRGYDGDVAKR
jgi:hypothetical protein